MQNIYKVGAKDEPNNMPAPEDTTTWMLVEDDNALRYKIEAMCKSCGLKVLSFKDGFGAAEYLKNEYLRAPLPQVALLDIVIPGRWGHEISAMIRQHPQLNDITIILMDQYAAPRGVEINLASTGADRLLFKPLPPFGELVKFVRETVRQRGTGMK